MQTFGIILWIVGFVVLISGNTNYPLRHEHATLEEFQQADRRSKHQRYAGGALLVVAMVIIWLT